MAEYAIPSDVLYHQADEGVRRAGEDVTVGVTDCAQSQLGDIVFVVLPEPGAATEAGGPFGTIESVKAVSDLFAPLTGEVIEINEALEDQPELVNESCYGDGWLIKLRLADTTELDNMLDVSGYRASVSERES